MSRINLLPWREELRKERQRQFLSMLGLVLVLGIVVVFSYKYTVSLQIESQVSRNNFLKAEIAKLDQQIQEIQKLEQERQRLIDRMKMITSLQQSRPRVVRIFDEMVRAVPEGLNLRSMNRRGNQLILIGSAESAQRVTSFMRKIDASEYLKNGTLKDIDTDRSFGGGRKAFSLTVDEVVKEDNQAGGS
ncbi:MAG: PilN domain-containing protein [Gammaproteobacteria bacterium]|nr:PilN domain-containing protein [Gammaproteobacteria bacterium]